MGSQTITLGAPAALTNTFGNWNVDVAVDPSLVPGAGAVRYRGFAISASSPQFVSVGLNVSGELLAEFETRGLLTLAAPGARLVLRIAEASLMARDAPYTVRWPPAFRDPTSAFLTALGGLSPAVRALTTLTLDSSATARTDRLTAVVRGEARGLAGRSEIYAVELTHPALPDPARFVRDTVAHTIEGEPYAPVAFNHKRADDAPQKISAAQITVDQVGRPLMAWVEASGGGRGAHARMMQVAPPEPGGESEVLWSQRLPVSIAKGTNEFFTLGLVGNIHARKRAVQLRYTPTTAPGIFP